MAANLAPVLRYIRRLAGPACPRPESDAALLDRFARVHDEAAFASLVARHGPMVLGVCGRVLGDAHDAEDAFQATFFILARKAGVLSRPEALAAFLYGTAYRVARKARGRRARRPPRELSQREAALPDPQPDPLAQVTARELLSAVEEEVQRLPEAYRLPVVLCCLEGLSREEAARRLGWAPGAVKGRLERGRKRLHERLVKRGLTLSAALAAVELARGVAPAQVPAGLLTAALKAACVGDLSARVAALAEGGLKGAAPGKVKLALVLLLGLAMTAAGAGAAAHRVLRAKPPAAGYEAATPGPASMGAGQAEPDTGSQARADYYNDPLPPGVLARMGSVQLRHADARLAFTADGKTLISAGSDLTVGFWDMAAGRLVRRTPVRLPKPSESEPQGPGAGLSPDGKRLAVFCGDWVCVYDTATGQELRRLPAGGIGHQAAVFSRDGKLLVTMLGRGGHFVLRLWDLPAGKERLTPPDASFINDFTLSPDGKLLGRQEGSAGKESLSVWDTATGQERGRVPREGGGGGVAFSPDGKTLASGDRYGTVTLWEAATLKKQATLKPAVARWTSAGLAYSPDGALLAVATDKDVVLWDIASRTERRRLGDRDVRRLAFAPDGKTLACAGEFEIRLWDPTTGEELHPRPGHDHHVWSVAISPDGKILASACWNDPVMRLWEAAIGKPLRSLPGNSISVRSCAFAADGKLLVSDCDGTLRLCSAATGEEVRRFLIKDGSGLPRGQEVLVCHLSPDGKRLAAVSTTWDKKLNGNRDQLSVWDARTGEPLVRRPFRGGLASLNSRFTPDGTGVTVDGTSYLTIEDSMTGRERAIIPGNLGNPVAFSPDGELVAAGIHKPPDPPGPGYQSLGVRVAEILTGQEIFHVPGWIDFTAFSPDGRVLATADPQALRLWDALTGASLFERPWPDGLARGPLQTPISSLVFLPTGRGLATGMGDGTILVWDLAAAKWPADGPARSFSPKELADLWDDLGGDARRACAASHALASAPGQAVPFLRDHLQPVPAADPKRVEKWIGDLDSDQFEVREAASRELGRLGEQAEPALPRLLQGKPPTEARRRAQALLDGLRATPSAPVLRTLRAIRLLARLCTPEVRQVLTKLAAGAPAARETREAREALELLPGR